MALKTCEHCGRKFSSVREKCPSCKRRHIGSDSRLGRFGWVGLAIAAVLLVTSLVFNLRRETGPPPEMESGHSSADAVRECLSAIASELRRPIPPFSSRPEVDYLGGGEYLVEGAALLDSGPPATPVVCAVRFRPDQGWLIDHLRIGA